MKVVVNRCFGGFGLSPLALKRISELQGRKSFFFKYDIEGKKDKYVLIPLEDIDGKRAFPVIFAFDIENPDDFSDKELFSEHFINDDSFKRDDPLLVQVVEELGEKANGICASLEVVEIPDGTKYRIDEYDGRETIAEGRTW